VRHRFLSLRVFFIRTPRIVLFADAINPNGQPASQISYMLASPSKVVGAQTAGLFSISDKSLLGAWK
jgi:hypothetical protein